MKYMAAVLLLVAAMSAQNAPSTNKGRHLDIPAISREANGAIVSIVMSDKDGHPIAKGSGFFISKDGHVLTNYHVIRNGSSAVIKLPNGAFFAVDGVLASDKDRDVAVIKAHGNDFRTLTLGDSDRLQVGEEVVAIGNPLSLESTVSNGIVSAMRTVEDDGGKFVQITAPISPGSSGGPLFNMAGEVVGITTSHIKGGENLNFAIPINDVKPMLLARSSKAHALPDEPEPAAAEQTTGPSLADTLQWIKTSSADGLEMHEQSMDTLMYIFPDGEQKNVSYAPSSCQNFKVFIHVEHREGATSTSVNFIFGFDLGFVDPGSVEEEDKVIKFGTTDNKKNINIVVQTAVDLAHLKSHQLMSSDDSWREQGFFYVGDNSYRSRLTKAFKHAVILCGGKPSTF